jgi:hypothetical protein
MKSATTKRLCWLLATTAIGATNATAADQAGQVTSHSQGLHSYIGFGHEKLPADGGYSAGMGFYAAVWPLVDRPLADFQIGLPSSWIQPDNSDNKDKPLAPEGTLARTWKPRGPTWSSVFQTVEGGLGYWAGNHFRYGPPKFSMNATLQCYDYEVGSPGWSFFYSNEALPDNRLGIAQLSNRLLIPKFAWIIYVFGAFLILTGIKMIVKREEEIHPERNPVARWFKKLMPVTPEYRGDKFFVRENGIRMATPLFVVLLLVEFSDLIFAVDSIPAIFAVTKDPFIVYTSNVFAILGLRSLDFALAGVNFSIRFPPRRDKPGSTAWLAIDELVPPLGKGSLAASKSGPVPGLELIADRRLNGDKAWYRVNLGPKPRILLGKVYRFPAQ